MSKNVLLISNSLKLGGGAERITAELGSNLSEKGYNILFLTFYKPKSQYEIIGEKICLNEEVNRNFLSDIIKTIKRAKKINEICEERNIDTVISFLFTQNLPAILSKVIFRNKTRIIISVRNNPIRNETLVFKKIIKRTYPKADKVVVQTDKIKEILLKKFSIDNTVVIPNMFDLEKFKKSSKKTIIEKDESLFSDGFTFITVGSMRKQKGQWYLVRCFKYVSQYHPGAKLIMLGDGPLKNELMELVEKMDLKKKVFFLGKKENVFPYLKKSNCFVFTSFYEGFPNVVTEALSQDLPVVSTDCVSGPREILCPEVEKDDKVEYPYNGKYGILTESFKERLLFKTIKEKPLSKKERMLSKIMMKMIENCELRAQYSKGSERVEDFKHDKIVPLWEDLI